MDFSRETQEKINQFAKEQSRHYLNAAEMTHIEKLRRKAGQTKKSIGIKLSKFKGVSGQAVEAQNDMVLFMCDYIEDLMTTGLSEEQAFEKAKEALSSSEDSDLNTDLQERFRQYYENQNPADFEAVGLFYGGFLFVGSIAGALIGYIVSGGRQTFLHGGWIDTLIGIGAGALLGIGIGVIFHAIIAMRRKEGQGGQHIL